MTLLCEISEISSSALSILKIDLLDFFVIQASLWKKEQSLISIITSLYQY